MFLHIYRLPSVGVCPPALYLPVCLPGTETPVTAPLTSIGTCRECELQEERQHSRHLPIEVRGAVTGVSVLGKQTGRYRGGYTNRREG